MTRENKLALVVGFGLILFVGILISDHFSVARHQASANLMNRRIDDPLVLQGRNQPDLIALKPEPAVSTSTLGPSEFSRTAPMESMTPEQRSMVNRDVNLADGRLLSDAVADAGARRDVQPVEANRSDSRATLHQASELPGFVRVTDEQSINVKDLDFHDVQNGESMYAICKKYYGSTELIEALARFNNIGDPTTIRQGRRLMIPPPETLGGKPRAPAARTPPLTKPGASPATTVASNTAGNDKPAKVPAKTYTVKPGDSLSGIAKRVLGDRDRWRDLHKLNKSVIDDPDKLRAGMVLKLG